MFINTVAYRGKMAEGKSFISSMPAFYFWGALGAIAAYLLRLLLARSLSPATYGAYYEVIGLFVFLSVSLNDFGLSQSFLFHFTKEKDSPKEGKNVFTTVFVAKVALSLVLGAVFTLFHEWFAIHYFHNVSLSKPILLFSLAFLFQGLAVFAGAYYGSLGRLKLYSFLAQAPIILTTLLSGVVFLVLPPETLLTGYFLAWLLAFALTAAICVRIPFSRLLTRKVSPGTARKVKDYALLVFLSAAGGILLSSMDILFLTYFRSSTEVGFFAIAMPVAALLLVFTDPLISFLAPVVVHRHHRKEHPQLAATLGMIYSTGIFLLLPLSLFLALFAKEVILVMFGEAYVAAAPALVILAIGTLFRALQGVNLTFLFGTGLLREQMRIMWIGAGVNVLLGLALIPRFGFVAAAFTTSASFLLIFALSFIELKRKLSFPFDYRAFAKSVALAAVSLALAFWLKGALQLPLYAKAGLIGAVFCAAYYGLGILVFRIIDYRPLLELLGSMTKRWRS